MPDYLETPVIGTKWRRCRYIHIHNPRPSVNQGGPTVQFVEETVVAIGDGEVIEAGEVLTEGFAPGNADELFDLLDPDTGEVTGSMTYQQLYVALASAYRHVAEKRDVAQAPAPAE